MATANQAQGSTNLNPEQLEVFSKAVKYILTEWPSLNFAIENGMGGSEAKQKHSWMIEHIIEIMIKGKDVDLDEYLAEIINQEFDTLVEDGSLEYNTQWINKFYKDCLQGKHSDVMLSIDQAAAKKQSLGTMRIPAPQSMNQESEDDESEDDEEDEMDC